MQACKWRVILMTCSLGEPRQSSPIYVTWTKTICVVVRVSWRRQTNDGSFPVELWRAVAWNLSWLRSQPLTSQHVETSQSSLTRWRSGVWRHGDYWREVTEWKGGARLVRQTPFRRWLHSEIASSKQKVCDCLMPDLGFERASWFVFNKTVTGFDLFPASGPAGKENSPQSWDSV